jgi:RHS repeat-associated protein
MYDALNRVIEEERNVRSASDNTVSSRGSLDALMSGKFFMNTSAGTYDVIQYTYDPLGRIVKKEASGSDTYTLNLSYDEVGNIKRISSDDSDGNYDVSYTYDNMGNILSLKDNVSGSSVFYNYYDDGRLKSRSVSTINSSLLKTDYTYDAFKNVLTLKTLRSGKEIYSEKNTYDANGNLIAQLTDEMDSKFTYDSLNRLLTEKHVIEKKDDKGAKTGTKDTVTLSYTYDSMGNRTEKRDSRKGVTTYSYDILNRLLTETQGKTATSYGYDREGNVTLKYEGNTTLPKAFTDTHLSDEITDLENLTGTITEYSYTLSGLLETVTENGHTLQENLYDAENLRSGRKVWTDEGTTDERYKTLSGKVIGVKAEITELSGNRSGSTTASEISRNLIYGNGLEKNGDCFTVASSHGDIKRLINAAGQTVTSYIYDAFGNLLNDLYGKEVNDFLYAGEQYDAAIDTYYLRARTYAPSLGRFLQDDNYLGDGRNLYTYVRNNPLKYVDPSGYCSKSTIQQFWEEFTSPKNLMRLAELGAAAVCMFIPGGQTIAVALLTDVAIDLATDLVLEVIEETELLDEVDGKTRAEISNGIKVGVGIYKAAKGNYVGGAAMIMDGAGGYVGGELAEGIYESVTGEDGRWLYEYGSKLGNLVGTGIGASIAENAGKPPYVNYEGPGAYTGITNSNSTPAKITNFLSDKVFTNSTNVVDNYVSDIKGYQAALNDFYALSPENVRIYDGGRLVGDIADNITINIHPSTSMNGVPSLEIFLRDIGRSIKIRY